MTSHPPQSQRFIEYAQKNEAALIHDFQLSSEGYNDEQVVRSREQYGSNLIHKRAHDTVLYDQAPVK